MGVRRLRGRKKIGREKEEQGSLRVRREGRRRQEDVEQHSEQDEDYISHNAQPEARVLEQLLVVGGEEDVADGHPRHAAADVGHEGDLGAFQV